MSEQSPLAIGFATNQLENSGCSHGRQTVDAPTERPGPSVTRWATFTPAVVPPSGATESGSKNWGDRRDSNPRQPEPQSGALPTELRPPSNPFTLTPTPPLPSPELWAWNTTRRRRVLAVARRLLNVGCSLLAIECWLLNVVYQPSSPLPHSPFPTRNRERATGSFGRASMLSSRRHAAKNLAKSRWGSPCNRVTSNQLR